eukprot:GHVU01177456.1.p1 GENE.GHVU01177456.1~~GHVU01177456.1.p1  ORF type:complete len:197 (+),score=54.17 GHVU01177456.1:875-1465(+)
MAYGRRSRVLEVDSNQFSVRLSAELLNTRGTHKKTEDTINVLCLVKTSTSDLYGRLSSLLPTDAKGIRRFFQSCAVAHSASSPLGFAKLAEAPTVTNVNKVKALKNAKKQLKEMLKKMKAEKKEKEEEKAQQAEGGENDEDNATETDAEMPNAEVDGVGDEGGDPVLPSIFDGISSDDEEGTNNAEDDPDNEIIEL